jgi:Zn-dependent protease
MLTILRDSPLTFVLLAAALLEAIALHEFAHALAADLQGDRMPRAMGRLTLNPAKHLDPLGTLCIFLVGFGWGKPVPFRPEAMSSRRFGAAIVALAGPMMNVALAIASALVIRGTGVVTGPVGLFLYYFLVFNVLLAVFNLIPVPPLDGSRLLTIFLPPTKQQVIFFLDRYGFMILLALLLLVGPRFLDPVVNPITAAIQHLAGLR